VSAAQALVKVGGADGQARVSAAMHDPLTIPNVRERLSALVTMPPAAEAGDAGAGPAKASADAGRAEKPKSR
jgi:hypothetical protein